MSPRDPENPALPPLRGGERTTPFEDFLLREYDNIATAHHNTVTSISEFFKHYIVIVSLPLSVAVLFLKPEELKTGSIRSILQGHPFVPGILCSLLLLIGLAVLGYVTNLRCDALLYARAVNGIRSFFLDSSSLSLDWDLRFQVLPKSTYLPKYNEPGYFLFVVATFALVGTAYFGAGWYIYWSTTRHALDWYYWLSLTASASAHFALYRVITYHREHAYLRGHAIGVDIDGVLNSHRQHFCQVLNAVTGKTLDPEAISRIPVHEIPGTTITEADEHAVFNCVQYWDEMPSLVEAPAVLRKLRNLLGQKIILFTHRGWPQGSSFPLGREAAYWDEWRSRSKWAIPARWRTVQVFERTLQTRGLPTLFSANTMRSITIQWLRRHGFDYDRLIIERGNTDTADPFILSRNRFVISIKRNIRVFIEDDLDKAIKLAAICPYVLLLDHPYNQFVHAKMPRNIIRVRSWKEIWECLRRLL